MNLKSLMRRNRFKAKNKSKADQPKWQWPSFLLDWRTNLRRAALLLALGAAVSALAWSLDRPVRVISMDGSFQRVSPGQIEKAVAPFANRGFMSADLDDIQRAVEALPWVDHARIARRWPNSLHVTVTEQTAAARWGDAGLLNTRGQLFVRVTTHLPPELPRLSGPEGTETQVAQRYLSAQGRMLEAGLRIAALRLDERGAWEMDLDCGVTVRLGRREVDERIDRFIRTTSQVISHRLTEINYVDMRYSNGFAIGWRNQGTPASVPAKRSDDSDA
ncbi:MAG: cell division protein FtsQ [Gammaproteobacteria bacterium]|nr:cell division protein FtsQ [Gammaproteobacteria bacterium]